MGEKRTFAEILEEKLGSPRGKTTPTPIGHPPISRVFIPFFTSETRQFSPTKNPYPKVRKPKIKVQPTPQPAPEKVELHITFWQLSNQEQQAYRQFVHLGAMLGKDKLTLDGVKKEYRRLAKKYHPDSSRSLTSQKFIQLKKLESILTRAIHQGIARAS